MRKIKEWFLYQVEKYRNRKVERANKLYLLEMELIEKELHLKSLQDKIKELRLKNNTP